jgi:hypothetical protein
MDAAKGTSTLRVTDANLSPVALAAHVINRLGVKL